MNWFTGEKSEADLEREASVQRQEDQAKHNEGQEDGSKMSWLEATVHEVLRGGPPSTPYEEGVANGIENRAK